MESLDVLTFAERAIPADDVLRLYRAEQWWPDRTATDLTSVLATSPAVGAWRGGRLVGFVRAITDGHFHAYIEDVVVDPAERGNGVGTALVRRIEALLEETVPMVTLFCSAGLAPFYESVGYKSTRQVILHHRLRD